MASAYAYVMFAYVFRLLTLSLAEDCLEQGGVPEGGDPKL